MLIIFARALFLYILVLIVMRIMGKREIGQMQPFEFTIAIVIADLASTPMADTGIPLSHGIIPILGLLLAHLVISYANIKSIKIRGFLCGRPSILIYRGRIDEKTLLKERFTINELQERLRGNGITNIADVEYAILETSGQVNVILKPEKQNITAQDLNLNKKYQGISYDLVIDGVIMKENLKKIGKDYKWFEKEIQKFGYDAKDALIVTIDGDNNIFFQEKMNANKKGNKNEKRN